MKKKKVFFFHHKAHRGEPRWLSYNATLRVSERAKNTQALIIFSFCNVGDAGIKPHSHNLQVTENLKIPAYI